MPLCIGFSVPVTLLLLRLPHTTLCLFNFHPPSHRRGIRLNTPRPLCLNQQQPHLVCCRLRTPNWNLTRSLHFQSWHLPRLPMKETAISYRLRFNPHSLPYHEPTVQQFIHLPSNLSTQSSAINSVIKTSIPRPCSAKSTICPHLTTFDFR